MVVKKIMEKINSLKTDSYKKIYIILMILLFLIVGCSQKKDIKTVSIIECRVKDNPITSTWKFDINSNNQILHMHLDTDITYEKLKKAFPKLTKDKLQQIYLEEKNKLGNDYLYITSKYPESKSWFIGSLSYDDSKMSIISKYAFNVIHERFNYELESGFLNNFGLLSLYDTKRKGFFYDENKINNTLFKNNTMICQKSN